MLALAIEQVSKDLLGIEVTLPYSQDLFEDIKNEEKGWLPSQCDLENFFPKGWTGHEQVERAIREELERRKLASYRDPITPQDKKRKREQFPTPPSDTD